MRSLKKLIRKRQRLSRGLGTEFFQYGIGQINQAMTVVRKGRKLIHISSPHSVVTDPLADSPHYS